MSLLTQKIIRRLLDYDEKTGNFYWKVRLSPARGPGEKAGCRLPNGYWAIKIKGRYYKAHRLAWLWVYGVLPKGIDHRNGHKDDNRLDNLRVASQAQNSANGPARSKTGIRGVYKHKNGGYGVCLCKDYRSIYVGYFKNLSEAKAAAAVAARELHQDFMSWSYRKSRHGV